mgnify:CR=1 FL=1
MNLQSPSFHLSQENTVQLNDISKCLKYTAYMIDTNVFK